MCGFRNRQQFLMLLTESAACVLSGSEQCCYRTFDLNKDTVLCSCSSSRQPPLIQIIKYTEIKVEDYLVKRLTLFLAGKFACKILIQGFSYAFPVNLTIPVAISLLITACGLRNGDPCFFHNVIPDYLFFESPPVYFLNDFITKQVSYCQVSLQNHITSRICFLRDRIGLMIQSRCLCLSVCLFVYVCVCVCVFLCFPTF